jgi:putative transcriptional regulator
MTQEDLAKKVGVRRETIGNLENERYNPSLVLAMNIVEVFNATMDELFQLVKKASK